MLRAKNSHSSGRIIISYMRLKRMYLAHSKSGGIIVVSVLLECVHLFIFFITITNGLTMVSKALRLVLLGPRAVDGSNKRRRSQSRSRKFAVTQLPKSLLAFVAIVVRPF